MNARLIVIPLVALVLLVAMGVATAGRISPADTVDYHARVREAVLNIPTTIAGWEGTDLGLPEFALNLLKPNVIVHRDYKDPTSDRHAQFTFVHSRHARNLIDHYPPSCYPSFGWTYLSEEKLDWPVQWLPDGKTITGSEFAFSSSRRRSGEPEIYVRNFIILYRHGIHRDHKPVHVAAADFSRRLFGAAQMSVMIPADVPRPQRDRIFNAMLEAVGDAVQNVLDES